MGVRLLLISTKVTKKQPESWTPVEQEYLLFIQVFFMEEAIRPAAGWTRRSRSAIRPAAGWTKRSRSAIRPAAGRTREAVVLFAPQRGK